MRLSRGYQSARKQRFNVLCDSLLPEADKLKCHSDAEIELFLSDDFISPHLRTFIAWFALVGTMPTESEVKELLVLLHLSNKQPFMRRLQRAAQKAGRRARGRLIETTTRPAYDCTHVRDVRGSLSGIPRVSRLFLEENPDLHSTCFAWADGVMGRVEFVPKRDFATHSRNWGRMRRFPDFADLRRRANEFMIRRTSIVDSRLVFHLYLAFGLLATELVFSVLRLSRPGPRVALLPVNDIWVFEPISTDAATRMIALKLCVPNVKQCVMVYDVLPVQIPDNFMPMKTEFFVHQLRMMSRCDRVLTDSLHLPPIVSAALESMEPTRIPEITAHPLHIDSKWLTPSLTECPATPHFLQIGALETRKNHHFALSAFSSLRATEATYSVVGGPRKQTPLIRDLIVEVENSGKIVNFIHGLSDEEVVELAKTVTAVVYPSAAEGYGLPILEGLAMGLPVIASDIPPHRQFERIGGIVYFDPTNVGDLARAMQSVLEPELNNRLREGIQFDLIPANQRLWAAQVRRTLEDAR